MRSAGPVLRARALRAVLLSLAAVASGAATAQAAVNVTLGGSDADQTMTVTSATAGGESPQFKDYAPGYTSIYSSTGFGAVPGAGSGCDHLSMESSPPSADSHVLRCLDAGNGGKTINHLVVTGGAGSDAPLLVNACFQSTELNLGDGDNQVLLSSACSYGTLLVNTGSGKDIVNEADNTKVAITANLGAGDDTAKGGGGALIADGGPGSDFLDGSVVGDTLTGGPDADSFFGRDGDDVLSGGDGDDTFDWRGSDLTTDSDAGADEYIGGAGADSVRLTGHPAGMNLSLNDVADDGAPGEGDNFHSDLEDIVGTTHDDTYVGRADPDKFDGDQGNDTIHGGGGADTLSGGSGNDAVFGDEGNDSVYGDYGDDTVDGGAGNDSIFGDLAGCSIGFSCPTGNDTIKARDGEADAVNCGLGADSAQVDATIDVVSSDALTACESVDSGFVGPKGQPNNPITPTRPFMSAVTGKPSSKKGVSVTVNCTVACSFTAVLSISKSTAKAHGLGKKPTTIGTGKATLLAPGGKAITVKLTKKARAKLGKLKKFSATVTVTVTTASAAPTSTTTAVTVKK
jgi:Ca2+-binding RTX toxin-like protein